MIQTKKARSKAKEQLNYVPRYSLEDGLNITMDYQNLHGLDLMF